MEASARHESTLRLRAVQGAAASPGGGGGSGAVPFTLDALREKAKKGEITIGESINLAILEEMARDPTTSCKSEDLQAVPKGTSAREQRGVEQHATVVGSATQDNAGAGVRLRSQCAAQLAADFAAEDNDEEAIAHTAAATAASAPLKTSGVMTSADLKARLRARGVSEAEVPLHVIFTVTYRISCADSTPCVHSASSSTFFARFCARSVLTHILSFFVRTRPCACAHIEAPRWCCL